ncbi:hypothetical protein [Cellulomonas iranensis]|uniref:hypothetical protein n=1 Tax=Cellulomonas iranensis TaxID=76862 RepID=UPI003D7DF532
MLPHAPDAGFAPARPEGPLMMDEILEEMIDPAPAREDVLRRRRLWATGAILVLAGVGVTSLTTAAVFTDQDTVSSGITTGSVVLTAPGEPVEFTVPDELLAPGGWAVAPVTVRNDGSLNLRYAVSVAAEVATPAGGALGDGDLREALRLRVYEAPAAGCSALSVPTAPEGALGDTGQGLPATTTPIVGSPERGAQPGDRQVGPGATGVDALCVRLDMADGDPASGVPSGTDDRYQQTAVAISLQFDSEQTVNNS